MATAGLSAARQHFTEAIAAFAQRRNLIGTARFDDLQAAEHYRGFAVAGAMKADLLAELHEAVGRAVIDGIGIEEFRKNFLDIAQRHGWHGWTGEGTAAGENWRTRVVYTTNVRKSHSAGRYAQLTDPDMIEHRPYWKWVHGGSLEPRADHLDWDGMTLKHDDPFWATHFPPRIPPDFGCSCRVVAVDAPAKKARTSAPAGWQKNADPGAGAPPSDVAADVRALVESKAASLPDELAQALRETVEEFRGTMKGGG